LTDVRFPPKADIASQRSECPLWVDAVEKGLVIFGEQ
jgi:hypothetical protein